MTVQSEDVTQQFTQLREDKQKRIISASLEEFAGKGYAAASLNSVVATAGIAKGSLFNYFSSKEGLFLYLYRMAVEEIRDYLRGVREQSREENLFDRLRLLFHAGIRFTRQHPLLARIYFRVLHTADAPRRTRLLRELHSESLNFLEKLLADGVAKGEVRADLNLPQAAFLVESVLNRFLQAQYLSNLGPESLDQKWHDEDRMEDWISGLVEMLRNGFR